MARAALPTHRRWMLAAVGLLAVHAALAWWLRAPAISTGHDDAIYLLLGRDLLRGSYRNFWLTGAPFHGLYPPLYPALLAVTGGGGEHGFPLAIALNVIVSVGW